MIEISTKELARQLNITEWSLRRKLCNYQLQPYVIYKRWAAPKAIKITPEVIQILKTLLCVKSIKDADKFKIKFDNWANKILKND